MTSPAFLADQNFNDHIISGVLRHVPDADFLRVRDVGMDASTDEEILAYAAVERRVVISHDVNTMSAFAGERIARGDPRWGAILIAQRQKIAPVIDDLVLICLASDADAWIDMIQFLPYARPTQP